jgi:hypothetical protein
MNSRNTVLLLIAVMTAACTSFSAVSYQSAPLGAMLSYKDGSGDLGIAPVRRQYAVDGDCFTVQGVVATWASGARAVSEDAIVFCGPAGQEFGVTLNRPPNHPGTDLDQSSAAEIGTLIQSGADWQQSAAQMYRSVQASQPSGADRGANARCRSRQSGNQVVVACD